MPNSRAFRFFALLSVGLVLRMIATGLEAMGDKAPFAADGVSGERLVFHGAALVLTIGALASFGWALYVLCSKRPKTDAEVVHVFEGEAPSEVEAAPAPTIRRTQPSGFGRKQS